MVNHSDSKDWELHFGLMLGQSGCFRRVIANIPVMAKSDLTVLITGETGTGKDLVARAIHYQSPRRNQPFIPVSAALPDHLCENELFGHIKGAFTGASSNQKGLVAEAEGGTLFLDDVENLSSGTQAKLLRFLQNGEYRPLGSTRLQHSNVRVITATNSDLRKQVQENNFREDLFYRLCVLSIEVPPLRDRVEDIPLLAEYFSNGRNGGSNGSKYPQLSPAVLQRLVEYHWPGNIRELKSVIERAQLLSSSPETRKGGLNLLDELGIESEPGIKEEPRNDTQLVGTLQQAKKRTVQRFEQAYLAQLLYKHKGNVSRAAKSAGTARRTFQRLIQKYQVDPNSYRNLS